MRNQETLSDNSVISGRNSVYTDGQRLELSERMMEVGHSELGLENKRKSKIPVRVFNYVLRFLSIREFRI